MADILQTAAPIIPVIDERLVASPGASNEHKSKIAEYNELLEVIYQREVELGSIKSSLADMREMIAQEARIIEAGSVGAAGIPALDASKSDSESDIDAEHVLSDASSKRADGTSPAKKVAKKNKKPKGSRRSKAPDAHLDGDWDFKLDLASRGAMNRGRRESDASDDSEPALV
ncbi:hypothetical protein BDN70DRAFT_857072 [Pholiota conissans]|uniref:Uncharacterized protein n=1 Tax=Pholiota conissans TaxID=109636 RepID=A0A9P5Z421_9AGAR|nr:hypothetical protein BDN70DRAFT_857072 [Pholiota conissans]